MADCPGSTWPTGGGTKRIATVGCGQRFPTNWQRPMLQRRDNKPGDGKEKNSARVFFAICIWKPQVPQRIHQPRAIVSVLWWCLGFEVTTCAASLFSFPLLAGFHCVMAVRRCIHMTEGFGTAWLMTRRSAESKP